MICNMVNSDGNRLSELIANIDETTEGKRKLLMEATRVILRHIRLLSADRLRERFGESKVEAHVYRDQQRIASSPCQGLLY